MTVIALILGLLLGLMLGALASLLLGRARKDAERAQGRNADRPGPQRGRSGKAETARPVRRRRTLGPTWPRLAARPPTRRRRLRQPRRRWPSRPRGGQGTRRAECGDRASEGDRGRPGGDAEPVQGAVGRDPRPAGQGGRRAGRAPAQGDRAADDAGRRLERFDKRLTEVEKERVAMAAELVSGAGRAADRRDLAPGDREPGHRPAQTPDPRGLG